MSTATATELPEHATPKPTDWPDMVQSQWAGLYVLPDLLWELSTAEQEEVGRRAAVVMAGPGATDPVAAVARQMREFGLDGPSAWERLRTDRREFAELPMVKRAELMAFGEKLEDAAAAAEDGALLVFQTFDDAIAEVTQAEPPPLPEQPPKPLPALDIEGRWEADEAAAPASRPGLWVVALALGLLAAGGYLLA